MAGRLRTRRYGSTTAAQRPSQRLPTSALAGLTGHGSCEETGGTTATVLQAVGPPRPLVLHYARGTFTVASRKGSGSKGHTKGRPYSYACPALFSINRTPTGFLRKKITCGDGQISSARHFASMELAGNFSTTTWSKFRTERARTSEPSTTRSVVRETPSPILPKCSGTRFAFVVVIRPLLCTSRLRRFSLSVISCPHRCRGTYSCAGSLLQGVTRRHQARAAPLGQGGGFGAARAPGSAA